MSAFEVLLALVVRTECVVCAHDWSDFQCSPMARDTLPKATSDQRTADPRGENARKVELDRGVCPLFDFLPSVDQVLHSGCVQVGDSCKVEYNGAKKRLALLGLELGFCMATLGSGVVPWSLTKRNVGVVATATSLGLDVLNNGRVDQRSVGIQERFLTAVSKDLAGTHNR